MTVKSKSVARSHTEFIDWSKSEDPWESECGNLCPFKYSKTICDRQDCPYSKKFINNEINGYDYASISVDDYQISAAKKGEK